MQDQDKPELSTFEVAVELNLSPPTVRMLAVSGQLRAWRFGKVYKFSREAVQQFKQSRELRPVAA